MADKIGRFGESYFSMTLNFKKIIIFVCLVSFGFLGGWLLKDRFASQKSDLITPLRLGGFKFIKPLLVCDTSEHDYSRLSSLEKKLSALINEEIQKNNISVTSVFFQDFKTNARISINNEEKFYAASLSKIPVMMAYYKIAQTNPEVLSQKIEYALSDVDLNSQQEIKPINPTKPDQPYTVQELIEEMIQDSDNNAADVLVQNLGVDTIHRVFSDLQVPFLDAATLENHDFVTASNFSFFFRVLYSSTYLNEEYSEKALEVLNKTNFSDGIVAGVPQGVAVAHKFGLATIKPKDIVISRELNDCGIVYNQKNPYLLCVMTKSSASLADIEAVIQRISALAYQEADSDYQ